jgi:RNA polymerase sigma-70 factor (ECF subfamily)
MHHEKTTEVLYKELFEREYANACRFALSFLTDTHMAEDAVQDVFIKLWEQKPEMLSSPGIKYYLITSVRNKCISILREQKSKGVFYPENAPESHEEHLTPLHHKENLSLQERKIADALGQLPPVCREVFLMVKLHGLSYKQAAEQLEVSVKTIENHMGKALRIFREYTQKVAVVTYLISFFKPVF